jgi:hypothetical protein
MGEKGSISGRAAINRWANTMESLVRIRSTYARCTKLIAATILCGVGIASPLAGQYRGDVGRTPELLRAASAGDTRRVDAIVHSGLSVDSRDKVGVTPLMRAASAGKLPAVKLLLRLGADPNARTLRRAKNEGGFTALAFAATNGRTEVIEPLVRAGALVNGRIADGKTPLMLAAMWGYTDTVKALLSLHAKTDLADAAGNTALHLARIGRLPTLDSEKNGHAETVRLLLRAGAKR